MKGGPIPDPELDALVRSLNDSAREEGAAEATSDDPAADGGKTATAGRPEWTLGPAGGESRGMLRALLAHSRQRHATDLLLVAGAPPSMRIHGELHPFGDGPLTAHDAAGLCAALLPAERRPALAARGAVDFSRTLEGLGRVRCNIHRERSSWSAAIRLFPKDLPDLEELNLPDGLARFAEMRHGLVLVTGPTGSGKSTTLAAILKRIVTRRRAHVITIEDPVEYEQTHGRCLVEHIEIGRDAPTFVQALRSALRQDPDILLIGEMRDRESISIAITAAETGHLVFSTLHTGDAAQTINRILDVYPAEQIDAVRTQLSISLAGIVSQRLLPRKDGGGRVPAVELVFASDAIRNLIRRGRVEQVRGQITLESAVGTTTLDHSLADLARRGLVDSSEARRHARAPNEFDALLRVDSIP